MEQVATMKSPIVLAEFSAVKTEIILDRIVVLE
jgi:hypothetical protein